jgi:hypothetical protein
VTLSVSCVGKEKSRKRDGKKTKKRNKYEKQEENELIIIVSTPHVGAYTHVNMELGIGGNCEMRKAELFAIE